MISLKILIPLSIASLLGNQVFAQKNISIRQGGSDMISVSPISLTAIEPGIEVNAKTQERWAAQSELPLAQVQNLVPQGKLTREKAMQITDNDLGLRARRLVEFLDGAIFKSNVASSFEKRASDIDWSTFTQSAELFQDIVFFASLNDDGKVYRENLLGAAAPGPEGARARTAVYKTLSDARLGAMRTARGYRQFMDILYTETRNRESESVIGLSFEVRAGNNLFATISPLSRAELNCGNGAVKNSSLLFTQRRRDCNDSGICRVESVSTSTGSSLLFQQLQTDGRKLLDGCNINLTMLVDGQEVSRVLPGRFTSDKEVPFTAFNLAP